MLSTLLSKHWLLPSLDEGRGREKVSAGGSIKVLYYWMHDEQGEGDVL